MNMNIPTFPCRPINGGPLDKALPKSGEWYYEPKYNGWRALVHVPTGTMFNRKGQRLTIEKEFAPALGKLRRSLFDVQSSGFDWLDCEALERRLPMGKGSLLIIDAPLLRHDYLTRRRILHNTFGILTIYQDRDGWLEENSVWSIQWFKGDGSGLGKEFLWDHLQAENDRLGCQFYEGVVAKRADSIYPIQLRSPDVESPFWIKHRWAW